LQWALTKLFSNAKNHSMGRLAYGEHREDKGHEVLKFVTKISATLASSSRSLR